MCGIALNYFFMTRPYYTRAVLIHTIFERNSLRRECFGFEKTS